MRISGMARHAALASVLGGALVLLASGGCGERRSFQGFRPNWGLWSFEELEVVRNTCGPAGDNGIDLSGPVGIVATEAGFTVKPGYGSNFECRLDDKSFQCEERQIGDLLRINAPADAASVRVGVVTAGEFTSESTASGTQKATVECEGADCSQANTAGAAALPCTIEVTFAVHELF